MRIHDLVADLVQAQPPVFVRFHQNRRRGHDRRRTMSRISKVAGKRHFFAPRLKKSLLRARYAATVSAFARPAETARRSVSASTKATFARASVPFGTITEASPSF